MYFLVSETVRNRWGRLPLESNYLCERLLHRRLVTFDLSSSPLAMTLLLVWLMLLYFHFIIIVKYFSWIWLIMLFFLLQKLLCECHPKWWSHLFDLVWWFVDLKHSSTYGEFSVGSALYDNSCVVFAVILGSWHYCILYYFIIRIAVLTINIQRFAYNTISILHMTSINHQQYLVVS